MFDSDLQPSKNSPVESHSWQSNVAALAYQAGQGFQNASWKEKIGLTVAAGAMTIGALRGLNVQEVAKVAELVAGPNSVIDKNILSLAKNVDHFVFDLDSTLTDYYSASKVLRQSMASGLQTATGLPESIIRQSLDQTTKKLGSAYFYNDLNQIDGIRKYYPDANLNEKFAGVSESSKMAYHDSLKASPETVELFDFLRSKGKSIHVFTASPTARAIDKLSASGLEPYVDKIFTAGPHPFDDLPSSGLIDAKSPMSRVVPLDWNAKETGDGYLAVRNKLNVQANKIAMTGDNLRQDIEPAKKVGMFTAQASWFLKETSRTILPDVELSNPREFQTILEQAYKK